MKKSFLFIVLISLVLSLFACGKKEDKEKITIIVPNGIPFLAIGGLLEDSSIEINPVVGGQSLQAALVSNDADIVIAPINVGAKLIKANKSSFKLVSPITFNNAYIVSDKTSKLDTIYDVFDNKITAFNEAGIPSQVLKQIYSLNNKDTNNIDFTFSSSAEVYALYAGGSVDSKYVLLSEPEISKLIISGKEINSLSLQDYFDVEIAQAAIFVNPNSNTPRINEVLSQIKDNINELNNDPYKYASRVASLDPSFEKMGNRLITSVLPNCNIKYSLNKEEINKLLIILGVGEISDEAYYKE